MRNIYADIRCFFAYGNLEKLNIGVLIHSYIKKEIIPELQKILSRARTDSEVRRINGLIEEYEKYSNPSRSESRCYTKTAAGVIRQLASRARIDAVEMEDLMQIIAVDLIKDGSGGGTSSLTNDLRSRFNIMGGPRSLNNFWASLVDKRSRYNIREITKKVPILLDTREDSEGRSQSPLDLAKAQERVDLNLMDHIIKELPRYVHRKLQSRNPKLKVMFDAWFETILDKGGPRTSLSLDVWPKVRAQGYKGNAGTFSDDWQKIKPIIMEFMKRELGSGAIGVMNKVLRMGSVDIVAFDICRKKMAAWVLDGMLYADLLDKNLTANSIYLNSLS